MLHTPDLREWPNYHPDDVEGYEKNTTLKLIQNINYIFKNTEHYDYVKFGVSSNKERYKQYKNDFDIFVILTGQEPSAKTLKMEWILTNILVLSMYNKSWYRPHPAPSRRTMMKAKQYTAKPAQGPRSYLYMALCGDLNRGGIYKKGWNLQELSKSRKNNRFLVMETVV
jgi:hypothetical protein